LQLYNLLLHKLVSFSLKYPAILDKCSLLKNNSSSLKALLLSSEKGFFHDFHTCGSQSDVPLSLRKSEYPWRVGQRLAGASRASPAALGLSAVDVLRCPLPPCSCSHLGREGEAAAEWRVQKASRGHSFAMFRWAVIVHGS